MLNQNDELKKKVIDKWEALGFLDDISGITKQNIAELYECQASHLLNETRNDGFPPIMHLVKRVFKKMTSFNMVPIVEYDWSVYIVECSDGTLYTGISNNVSKRISTHNEGKGAKYTRGRLPVALKWSKACDNKSEASKLENKIKKMPKKQKLKLIDNG